MITIMQKFFRISTFFLIMLQLSFASQRIEGNEHTSSTLSCTNSPSKSKIESINPSSNNDFNQVKDELTYAINQQIRDPEASNKSNINILFKRFSFFIINQADELLE